MNSLYDAALKKPTNRRQPSQHESLSPLGTPRVTKMEAFS